MAPSPSRRPPPQLFQLAAHPVRWHLLEELSRTDRRVGELTSRLGEQQNLVSYHLGRLRNAGVVTARRSSRDARDVYYSIDLARCAELLGEAGAAVHPGLGPAPSERPRSSAGAGARVRVLFVCTGNSARSPIAEALAARLGAGMLESASAGSHPKPLHPNAVRLARTWGQDLEGRLPVRLDELAGQRFDHVVTLCDRAREVCPEFAGAHEPIHWSTADPSSTGGSDEETYPAFEGLAAHLTTRITFLVRRVVHDLENTPENKKEHSHA